MVNFRLYKVYLKKKNHTHLQRSLDSRRANTIVKNKAEEPILSQSACAAITKDQRLSGL